MLAYYTILTTTPFFVNFLFGSFSFARDDLLRCMLSLLRDIDKEIGAEGAPLGFVEVEEGDGGVLIFLRDKAFRLFVFRNKIEFRRPFRIADLTVEFDEGKCYCSFSHRVLAMRHTPRHLHAGLPA